MSNAKAAMRSVVSASAGRGLPCCVVEIMDVELPFNCFLSDSASTAKRIKVREFSIQRWGRSASAPSPSVLKVTEVNSSLVIRYTILAISAAAMVLGVLVIAGLLVPVYLPSQFSVIFGAVIFLYGLYRFVVTYFQHRGR
jgi:hypothetical protein